MRTQRVSGGFGVAVLDCGDDRIMFGQRILGPTVRRK